MRNETFSRFSRKTALSAEDIRKKEHLRTLVGTDEFPMTCPIWILDVPDGYRFWYELMNLHRGLGGTCKR